MAVGVGTAKAVTSLGQALTGFLDTAANLAQVATGVDDQQVRDELASTRGMVTDVIDVAINGDYKAGIKKAHSAAVNRTADAFGGDVSAISDVSESVSMLATLKPGAGPRVLRGPTVSQSAKAVSEVVKQVAKSKAVTAITGTVERALTAGGNRMSQIAHSAATGVRESVKTVIQASNNIKPKNFVINMQPGDSIVQRSVDVLVKHRKLTEIGLNEVSKLRAKDRLTIVAHGSPETIGGFSGTKIAEDLISKGFKAKKIDLFSCKTGSGCASEQLADLTKATVSAPFNNMTVLAPRTIGSARVVDNAGKYYRPEGQGFRLVKPQGKVRDGSGRSEKKPLLNQSLDTSFR